MFPLGRQHHVSERASRADIRAIEAAIEANHEHSFAAVTVCDGESRLCTFVNGRAHSAVRWTDDEPLERCSLRSVFESIRDGRPTSIALYATDSIAPLAIALISREQPIFRAPASSVGFDSLIGRVSGSGVAVLREDVNVFAYLEKKRVVRVVTDEALLDGDEAHRYLRERCVSSSADIFLFNELKVLPDVGSGPLRFLMAESGPPTALLFEIGEERRRIQRADDEILIGRAPDCDVVVDEPDVSRRHALLRWHGDHYEIVDLGSAGGTEVVGRGAVTASWRVNVGDQIRVANVPIALCESVGDVENTGTAAVHEVRRIVAPHLIAHTRAHEIDRKVFRLTSGPGGHLALGGTPGTACTLIVNEAAVVLHADEGGENIRVNDQPMKGPTRLFSGDRIQLGRIPVVFAMMVPRPQARSRLDQVLASFVRAK